MVPPANLKERVGIRPTPTPTRCARVKPPEHASHFPVPPAPALDQKGHKSQAYLFFLPLASSNPACNCDRFLEELTFSFFLFLHSFLLSWSNYQADIASSSPFPSLHRPPTYHIPYLYPHNLPTGIGSAGPRRKFGRDRTRDT
ncbi:hypothetical protein SODALDRAFT_29063 [Sodiomyces alkalinus F11]|uniref:Uncharacterized protein n=1 Tax=Sodiomyces alkalinus (strain CBS 110278 / VKM F-3762 / F11) TaxID=1314773 RepID=A0A3N2Q8D6_SODAK|nr:hypothetical protein SODALDRAFT_29063 [Sodiomyces alkalinus F11]ROT43034.1 hypothetical protein SODALDRAFT_29063 [Sodiomyces alkalinus F11]